MLGGVLINPRRTGPHVDSFQGAVRPHPQGHTAQNAGRSWLLSGAGEQGLGRRINLFKVGGGVGGGRIPEGLWLYAQQLCGHFSTVLQVYPSEPVNSDSPLRWKYCRLPAGREQGPPEQVPSTAVGARSKCMKKRMNEREMDPRIQKLKRNQNAGQRYLTKT